MTTYGPDFGVVRDVHDGDTCGIDLDLGYSVAVLTRSVFTGNRLLTCRLYGINAPELKVDAADNPAGLAARDYLARLLPPGTKVTVVSHGWDAKAGRFDGTVVRVADQLIVNDAMVLAGHASVSLA